MNLILVRFALMMPDTVVTTTSQKYHLFRYFHENLCLGLLYRNMKNDNIFYFGNSPSGRCFQGILFVDFIEEVCMINL